MCVWLLFKNKKSLFEPTLRGLRGNVHTPSIARGKARGQLSVCHNWTFSLSYGSDVISGNLSKSAFFEGGWVTFGECFGWKGTIPSNPRSSGKTRDIPVSYGVEILIDDYFLLSQYTILTDRRADRQNCDSNTVRCITCSRSVKTRRFRKCSLFLRCDEKRRKCTHKPCYRDYTCLRPMF